jgi:hypothetical protein
MADKVLQLTSKPLRGFNAAELLALAPKEPKYMDALEERLWMLTVVLLVVVAAQSTLLVMALVGGHVNRKNIDFLIFGAGISLTS